jgi:hypothetical protein
MDTLLEIFYLFAAILVGGAVVMIYLAATHTETYARMRECDRDCKARNCAAASKATAFNVKALLHFLKK